MLSCAEHVPHDIYLTLLEWHSSPQQFAGNGRQLLFGHSDFIQLSKSSCDNTVQIGLHVVVPEAAELGTDDFVLADLGRGEMHG